MKKTKYFLTLLAATTIVSAGIGKAWAYFTTYTEASGGYRIDLGDETRITEGFEDWTKHVEISSEEGSEPVYIRARAFCAEYPLEYVSPTRKWIQHPTSPDDYWYYTDILNGGDTTNVLDIKIKDVPKEDKEHPENSPEIGDRFNVIVIYESIPVKYKPDGTAYRPWDPEVSWDEKLEVVETTRPAKPEIPENPDTTEGGNQ